MSSTRKSILFGAALLLGSALGASAADLYSGGSYKDAPVMSAMPAPSAGWYVRLDGGYDFSMNPTVVVPTFNTKNVKMEDSGVIGGGIGHYFGHGFRGDLTIDHIFDERVSSDVYCGCSFIGSGHVDFTSTVFLANLYYDFNRGGRFVPYIGAGVGFAHNETSQGVFDEACGCTQKIGAGSSTNFAAAAMAGLAWRIRGGQTYSGGLKGDVVAVAQNALWLDVGYRFLYLGDVKTGDIYDSNAGWTGGTSTNEDLKQLMSHEVRVGLRYDIN